MLEVGQKAPAFSLPSTSGERVSLADFAGRKVVLYFYPKDDTPGCTREACDFRDNQALVKKAGAVVLGVSRDPLAAHAKFRAKYALPFDLLVDEGGKVATAYGAFGEKTLYGRKFMGIIRSTFMIDERGRIAALWSPVKVDGHADAVLAALGVGAAKPAAAKAAPARRAAKKSAAAKPARKKAARS